MNASSARAAERHRRVEKRAETGTKRPTRPVAGPIPTSQVACFAALNSMNLGYDIGVNSGVGYHLEAEGEGARGRMPRPEDGKREQREVGLEQRLAEGRAAR